ncbi:WhiB family transcriptional regulator [Candidatus Saccharibacteria bacterium]|nr:WhiB family transcriptional regulator [Candidatus Saccharibacteria bacterium]MBI3338020.1 WhiB family transcriptional regulator [Candidatus Saccharibacteria bacterium]
MAVSPDNLVLPLETEHIEDPIHQPSGLSLDHTISTEVYISKSKFQVAEELAALMVFCWQLAPSTGDLKINNQSEREIAQLVVKSLHEQASNDSDTAQIQYSWATKNVMRTLGMAIVALQDKDYATRDFTVNFNSLLHASGSAKPGGKGMIRGSNDDEHLRKINQLAACKGCSPEMFQPETEASPIIEEAKKVCSGCGVRDDCLDYAISHNATGIWGGTTDQERKNLAKKH